MLSLLDHSLLTQHLQDPSFQKQLQQSEGPEMLNHPKLKELVQSPDIRTMLSNIGWQKIHQDLQVDVATPG